MKEVLPSPADGDDDIRSGERRFARDPAQANDASLCFIGRIRSPWTTRENCPKNMRQARETGHLATIEIDAAFREGLTGLSPGVSLHVLTWLDRTRRDLAIQAPRRSDRLTGTFSLRSPVRPNPIGLHLVTLRSIDAAAGRLEIDAIDALDETPVLDLKPYFDTVDRPSSADPAASA